MAFIIIENEYLVVTLSFRTNITENEYLVTFIIIENVYLVASIII